jgi:hypothetical protein
MCPYLDDNQPPCRQPPTLQDLERAMEFCAFDHRQCPAFLECCRHEQSCQRQSRQHESRH